MKILFCILVLFFSNSLILAHTCMNYESLPDKEYNQRMRGVDNIFYGEIVSVTDLDYQSFLIKYKVLRVWKGNAATEMTVKFADPCGTIGLMNIQTGKKRIVFGYASENETFLNENCCGVFNETRMKREYGEGVEIEHPIQQTEQIISPPTATEGFWENLWNKVTSLFS